MKTIWIDTETGGLDPEKDALLSVALYDPIQGIEFFSKIKPPVYLQIHPEAAKINGYTPESWEDAPSEKDVMNYVRGIISPYDFFGGANVEFDRGFLRAAFARSGLSLRSIPCRTRELQTTAIDTVECGYFRAPRDAKGRVSYSLDSISSMLGIENPRKKEKNGIHGALEDIKLTVKCAETLLNSRGKRISWKPYNEGGEL